jgi:hypothetical protein
MDRPPGGLARKEQDMSAYLDLDDAAAPHPKAAKELAELRAELAALRAQEPVGEIVGTEKRGFAMMTAVRWEPGFNRTMPGTKLYAHPAPAQPAADAQALRDALTELRDRLAGHPAYQPLTEAEEQDIGGDTAELSYLVRVADEALGTDRSEAPK